VSTVPWSSSTDFPTRADCGAIRSAPWPTPGSRSSSPTCAATARLGQAGRRGGLQHALLGLRCRGGGVGPPRTGRPSRDSLRRSPVDLPVRRLRSWALPSTGCPTTTGPTSATRGIISTPLRSSASSRPTPPVQAPTIGRVEQRGHRTHRGADDALGGAGGGPLALRASRRPRPLDAARGSLGRQPVVGGIPARYLSRAASRQTSSSMRPCVRRHRRTWSQMAWGDCSSRPSTNSSNAPIPWWRSSPLRSTSPSV